MAKRTSSGSLTALARELSLLEGRRDILVAEIQRAVASLGGGTGTGNPGPARRGPGRPKGSGKKKGGRKKGFKMSKAAKAKISAAQKKRWAQTFGKKSGGTVGNG